jgi:hypothetical protein
MIKDSRLHLQAVLHGSGFGNLPGNLRDGLRQSASLLHNLVRHKGLHHHPEGFSSAHKAFVSKETLVTAASPSTVGLGGSKHDLQLARLPALLGAACWASQILLLTDFDMSSESTPALVPPGSQTGIYYIPICNVCPHRPLLSAVSLLTRVPAAAVQHNLAAVERLCQASCSGRSRSDLPQ